jgi:hypothetical protein
MVDLNAHEAGNGGQSQGTPKAQGVLLYSEFDNNPERLGVARTSRLRCSGYTFCMSACIDWPPIGYAFIAFRQAQAPLGKSRISRHYFLNTSGIFSFTSGAPPREFIPCNSFNRSSNRIRSSSRISASR